MKKKNLKGFFTFCQILSLFNLEKKDIFEKFHIWSVFPETPSTD